MQATEADLVLRHPVSRDIAVAVDALALIDRQIDAVRAVGIELVKHTGAGLESGGVEHPIQRIDDAADEAALVLTNELVADAHRLARVARESAETHPRLVELDEAADPPRQRGLTFIGVEHVSGRHEGARAQIEDPIAAELDGQPRREIDVEDLIARLITEAKITRAVRLSAERGTQCGPDLDCGARHAGRCKKACSSNGQQRRSVHEARPLV